MNEPQSSLNTTGRWVAIGLIGILAFLTWALVYIEIPAANANVLTVLTGILAANVGMVVGFFFGSSSTSKKQSDTIADQASAISQAQSVLAPLVGSDPAIKLAPGESATAKATKTGTVITPDEEPK